MLCTSAQGHTHLRISGRKMAWVAGSRVGVTVGVWLASGVMVGVGVLVGNSSAQAAM